MSVYSMTGYATAQSSVAIGAGAAESKGLSGAWLGIEIRSVNSRFLDLSFRLPEELRQFEPTLRELLGGRLKRGKVEVRATLETGSANAVAEPSVRLLQRLVSLQDSVRAWLPDVQPLGVSDVLRLASSDQSSPRAWGAEMMPLAEQALGELLLAREREGGRLAATLFERIDAIRKLAQQALPLVPQLVSAQRQRFLDRWNDAMTSVAGASAPESAQDRALAEATAFAMRIDVAEEITRLASHLDEVERLIKKGGEIGKRLDFLMQELHREANTMGSKSAALELTHISVDMKVLVEQMREQVQNIE